MTTDTEILERLDNIEAGLSAVESILRCSFPQYFVEVENDGNTEAISGSGEGPGEA